eukprot:tig00020571_g11497.t2
MIGPCVPCVCGGFPAGTGGGKARSALGFGGGFTAGRGRAARAEARGEARWGSAAASLQIQAARWGSVAVSLQVQVARDGRGRDRRRAGIRRRVLFRSRGVGGGETGGALGPVNGFSSGPGPAVRARSKLSDLSSVDLVTLMRLGHGVWTAPASGGRRPQLPRVLRRHGAGSRLR